MVRGCAGRADGRACLRACIRVFVYVYVSDAGGAAICSRCAGHGGGMCLCQIMCSSESLRQRVLYTQDFWARLTPGAGTPNAPGEEEEEEEVEDFSTLSRPIAIKNSVANARCNSKI